MPTELKNIVLLGSTGSIGTQTLDIVRRFPRRFNVVALSANRDFETLAAQARQFNPQYIVLADPAAAPKDLPAAALGQTKLLVGPDHLAKIAALPSANLVVNALVGSVGITPTIAAIQAGRDVALANKETLVSAGDLINDLLQKHQTQLFPLDSEHSAIWQCLRGEDRRAIRRLLITCSGGPFFGQTRHQLQNITPEIALKHPTWKMGPKISIDSATLMNKGFEVIEAYQLFHLPISKIEVIIHRQSLIHSLVEFEDRTQLAHVGPPDMRIPIQYALLGKERQPVNVEPLDLTKVGRLDFAPPDPATFPCLKMAFDCLIKGATFPTVLNAANEVAVAAFLNRQLAFLDIPRLIEFALARHQARPNPSLDDILTIDRNIKQNILAEFKAARSTQAQPQPLKSSLKSSTHERRSNWRRRTVSADALKN